MDKYTHKHPHTSAHTDNCTHCFYCTLKHFQLNSSQTTALFLTDPSDKGSRPACNICFVIYTTQFPSPQENHTEKHLFLFFVFLLACTTNSKAVNYFLSIHHKFTHHSILSMILLKMYVTNIQSLNSAGSEVYERSTTFTFTQLL